MMTLQQSFFSSSPLLSAISVLFLLSLILSTVHSASLSYPSLEARQSYTPLTTTYPASVYIDRKAFYILGGFSDANLYSTAQVFSIDLSTAWEAASPAFIPLNNSPFYSGGMVSTLASDEQNWFFLFPNGYPQLYNIISQSWSNVPSSAAFGPLGLNTSVLPSAISAVTDPSSGTIYIPNGYLDSTTIPNGLKLLIYSISGNVTPLPMHPDLVTLASFAVAWAVPRGGSGAGGCNLFIFGGATQSSLMTNGANPSCTSGLYGYEPASNLWYLILAKGALPSARRDACMVPFQINGAEKLVLFGGQANEGGTLGDIHIYDIVTQTWTQGQNVASSFDTRFGHACAVSNGMLIVWGGSNVFHQVQTSPFTAPTLVYNLASGQWVNSYSPSTVSSPSGSNSSSSSSPSSPGASNTSSDGSSGSSSWIAGHKTLLVILGAVSGVTVLIALIFFCRPNKDRSGTSPSQMRPSGFQHQTYKSRMDSYAGERNAGDSSSITRFLGSSISPPAYRDDDDNDDYVGVNDSVSRLGSPRISRSSRSTVLPLQEVNLNSFLAANSPISSSSPPSFSGASNRGERVRGAGTGAYEGTGGRTGGSGGTLGFSSLAPHQMIPGRAPSVFSRVTTASTEVSEIERQNRQGWAENTRQLEALHRLAQLPEEDEDTFR